MSSLPAVPDNDLKPWERQPGETARAFGAFAVYRDLLWNRSLSKAAEVIAESSPARDPENIRRGLAEWSGKHHWQTRVAAFDAELDRRQVEARMTALERVRRDDATAGAVLTSIAFDRLKGRPAAMRPDGQTVEPVEAIDPGELDASDALAFLREGRRLVRLGHGLPTSLDGKMMVTSEENSRMVEIVMEEALALLPRDVHRLYIQNVRERYEKL